MKGGTLFHASGHCSEVEPVNGSDFKLDELQGFIGGYVEVINFRDGRILLVDEDGLSKKLPVNLAASRIAGQRIVGSALLCDSSMVE